MLLCQCLHPLSLSSQDGRNAPAQANSFFSPRTKQSRILNQDLQKELVFKNIWHHLSLLFIENAPFPSDAKSAGLLISLGYLGCRDDGGNMKLLLHCHVKSELGFTCIELCCGNSNVHFLFVVGKEEGRQTG